MSSSKLAFLALILALYTSDHFLILHGQEPSYPPESLPGQEPPSWTAPSPPAPPPDIPSSPSPLSITEPPGNDIASTPAPPPQSPPWPPPPPYIYEPQPPDVPLSPSPSPTSITGPHVNDIASTPAPPPQSPPWPPPPPYISEPPIDKSPPKIEPSYYSSGRSTQLGLIIGVSVGCSVGVVLCMVGLFAWIWRKRGTRQSGSDNPVSTRPLPTKADQFGGWPQPQQWPHSVPPPTHGGAALPPSPSWPNPPPGVLLNQQASPHNVASPLMYSRWH